MPTYEYRCDGCGNEFEREQRITESPVRACPKCGARKAHRQISNTSFQLKGSGWYAGGYAGATGSNGPAKASAKKDSGEKGATATTASAPAAAGSAGAGTPGASAPTPAKS